jgi:DNA-binding response OmpR family regulator
LPEQLRAFQAKLRRLPVRTEILINSERGTIRVDGEPRHLTPREFDLLAALGRQVGDPLTRAELLDAVRSGRELTEGSRTVDVHIAHLREKLALPGAIVTIRGRGYALSPALTVRFA